MEGVMESEADEARRRVLLGMLAAGGFAIAGVSLTGCGSVVGRRPERLAPDRSVWRAEDAFTVNGSPGTDTTPLRPGDTVETGASGGLVFVVGETAMFARPSTRLRLVPDSGGTRLERVALEAGAVLTVFPERVHRIETPLAVVGIRGTGVYAAIEPGRDYICTCYGTVDIDARTDAASRETIESVRHDAPRYVLGTGATGTRVQPAPFKDHSDAELLMLEALVGREPPYAVREDAYGMPRRRSY